MEVGAAVEAAHDPPGLAGQLHGGPHDLRAADHHLDRLPARPGTTAELAPQDLGGLAEGVGTGLGSMRLGEQGPVRRHHREGPVLAPAHQAELGEAGHGVVVELLGRCLGARQEGAEGGDVGRVQPGGSRGGHGPSLLPRSTTAHPASVGRARRDLRTDARDGGGIPP